MHPMLNIPEKPLSQREEKLLAELEAVIDANMKGFVLVGMALAQIRDQRLYRIQYPTFEEYILRVWDMARSRAYQLIEAAGVHENLRQFLAGAENVHHGIQISHPENVHHGIQINFPPNVSHGGQTIDEIVPKNERQARPLTLFSPEEQREIWLRVLDEAINREVRITANFIIQVILERQRQAIDRKAKEQADRTRKGVQLPPLVQTTYQALLQVVINLNDEEWRSVGRQTLASMLEDLLATLKA